MAKKRRWLKFTVPAVLMVAAVGYLFFSGMQKSMIYYLTLAELADKGPGLVGKQLRVAGKVKAGSVVRPEGSSGTITFLVSDGGRDLPVTFTGVVPETFSEGGELLVEGRWEGAPVFAATTLIPKCPSKYEVALEGAEKENK
jgi:cytochrome c-type biogenesis protein CcmE